MRHEAVIGILLEVWAPELDTVFQQQSHQCHLREKTPWPLDADQTDSDTSNSDDENVVLTNDISIPRPQNEEVVNQDIERPTVVIDAESILDLEPAQAENEDLGDAVKQR